MGLVHELTEEELIAELQKAFVKRKSSTENGKRNYNIIGNKYIDSFRIAASTCRKLNACPVLFIDAIFANSDPDKIFPTFLNNANWCIKKFNTHIVENCTKAADLYPVLLKLLKSQLDLGRTLEEILLSDYLNFPAWFRVCISKEAIPEVMDKYCAQAELELTLDVKELLKEKGLDYRRIYGVR